MTDDEDDDMLFLAFSQFLGSPSPAEEESLLLEDPYMAPPATPPVKETWFSPLGKKSNSEQNVPGQPTCAFQFTDLR